ncbi:hypothetical protein ACOQH0_23520 (plasmid) [Enterobacter sp. JS8-1]|uniref:hypothetical protein n=1 Tax=Enterobacter sp. JS8-1 TaxID=3411633 RepID=UPI003BA39A5B
MKLRHTAALLSLLSIGSHAEITPVPYVSSYSTRTYRVENNTYVDWTTIGGTTSRSLPTKELDYTCADLLATSLLAGQGTVCIIAMVTPSEGGHEFLIAPTAFPKNETVRSALSRSNGNSFATYTNPTVNGYHPDGGSGCWTLTTHANYAGRLMLRGDYMRSQSTLTPTVNSVLNSSCMGVPPEDTYCEMRTPSVNFDFGTILKRRWGDTSLNPPPKEIAVTCTGDIKYTIRNASSADNVIELSNGGTADMTLDGDWGKTYQGSTSTAQHNIEVRLSGTPSIAGPFEGKAILAVDYP